MYYIIRIFDIPTSQGKTATAILPKWTEKEGGRRTRLSQEEEEEEGRE